MLCIIIFTRKSVKDGKLQKVLIIHKNVNCLSILLALTNGAIVSRRQKLADKVFEQKVNVKVIDGIVRLL